MNLAEARLGRAYTSLILKQPFVATVLLRLRRIEDNNLPTMWTDGRHLGYNTKFVESLTPDELVGVLAHEVFHVTGLHNMRRGDRDPFGWNIACDAVVNNICEELGLTLPKGGVPGVKDKSAEEVYEDLPNWMKQPEEYVVWGEVRDAKNPDGTPLSPAQERELEEEMKITIRQAVAAAKRQGKMPDGLKRFVDKALEPRVPWKELLAQFISAHAKSDFNWSVPNRRYQSSGIIFPSLYSPEYGKVFMGCDTSGSIEGKLLQEICSEVLGLLAVYETSGVVPELQVLWFDADVYPQVITDEHDIEPKGGGGTSYAPVFKWIAENEEKPVAIIMVTDGICNDWGEQPEQPVLWILTSPNSNFNPPFGMVAATINK